MRCVPVRLAVHSCVHSTLVLHLWQSWKLKRDVIVQVTVGSLFFGTKTIRPVFKKKVQAVNMLCCSVGNEWEFWLSEMWPSECLCCCSKPMYFPWFSSGNVPGMFIWVTAVVHNQMTKGQISIQKYNPPISPCGKESAVKLNFKPSCLSFSLFLFTYFYLSSLIHLQTRAV